MTKLSGSMTTDRRVEIPVIVTLRAKSALKREHHPVGTVSIPNEFHDWEKEIGAKNGVEI